LGFRYIFRQIFPDFYSKITIGRTRLTLSDEDPSQYTTLENIITGQNIFSRCTVMLCIYHAVWKLFKELIKLHLPRKGQLLSTEGHDFGVKIILAVSIILEQKFFYILFYHIWFFLSLGGCLLNWFMRMCNKNETKV